jgi:hypothetical protein
MSLSMTAVNIKNSSEQVDVTLHHPPVTFRACCPWGVVFSCPPCEGPTPHKAHPETPIERIFREVTGRRMPPSVKRILLRKRKAKAKST